MLHLQIQSVRIERSKGVLRQVLDFDPTRHGLVNLLEMEDTDPGHCALGNEALPFVCEICAEVSNNPVYAGRGQGRLIQRHPDATRERAKLPDTSSWHDREARGPQLCGHRLQHKQPKHRQAQTCRKEVAVILDASEKHHQQHDREAHQHDRHEVITLARARQRADLAQAQHANQDRESRGERRIQLKRIQPAINFAAPTKCNRQYNSKHQRASVLKPQTH